MWIIDLQLVETWVVCSVSLIKAFLINVRYLMFVVLTQSYRPSRSGHCCKTIIGMFTCVLVDSVFMRLSVRAKRLKTTDRDLL